MEQMGIHKPKRGLDALASCGDRPVRGGEGQVVLTHLPLQAQAAPATAVPIAAGETREAGHSSTKPHTVPTPT